MKSVKKEEKTKTAKKGTKITKKKTVKVTTNKNKKSKVSSNKKKKNYVLSAIIPLLIGAFTLILVTIGATYAYFSVVSSNTSSTTNVNTSIDGVGSVSLNKTNANLRINLNGTNMAKMSQDVDYYASSSGTTQTETEEVIGEITAMGNGTFTCEYDIIISASATNSMYTAFQNMTGKSSNQIVLTVNGTSYDFITENLFPKTVHNVVNGVEQGTTQDITAALKIVNKKNVDQSSLAGTDITISFNVNNFRCTIAAS